jgi:hypothetical protein
MIFNPEAIKIKRVFMSESLNDFVAVPFESKKIKAVYGDYLKFPPMPKARPYIFASFVTSVDGKLAYADKPSAFFVAAKNELAGNGSITDFWMFNALRGLCDAAMIGGNSLR